MRGQRPGAQHLVDALADVGLRGVPPGQRVHAAVQLRGPVPVAAGLGPGDGALALRGAGRGPRAAADVVAAGQSVASGDGPRIRRADTQQASEIRAGDVWRGGDLDQPAPGVPRGRREQLQPFRQVRQRRPPAGALPGVRRGPVRGAAPGRATVTWPRQARPLVAQRKKERKKERKKKKC